MKDPRQIASKFKHAADFGVTGNYNRANGAKFEAAIDAHVARPGIRVIPGTYRHSQRVIHYVDPASGLDVMTDSGANFVSGWKLNPTQLQNVLKNGSL